MFIDQTFISLDLETTGIKPEVDEIIEIAAVKFRGDRILSSWQTLVNPQRHLPYRTQRFTGISQRDLEKAPSLAAVAGQLMAFVKDHPIVGQSVSLDVAFLAKKGASLDNRVYDTFDLASILLPELSNYTLASLAEHLGVAFPIQHRALPDAIAAKDVFLELLRRVQDLDLGVIGEISKLMGETRWPLYPIFQEIERERVRSSFSRSLGDQLAQKVGLENINRDFLVHNVGKVESLKGGTIRRTVDPVALSRILEAGGIMEMAFPGFERRAEQVQMLKAVTEAFNNQEKLVVEAGTGTGKSVAYLLPSIMFAINNKTHVAVSTNTINLQEQLFEKDIPDIQQFLNSVDGKDYLETSGLIEKGIDIGDLKIAMVKGRSNYLCLRKWNHLRKLEGVSSLDEAKVLTRILVWMPKTSSGDREELNLMPGELEVWGKINAQTDNCLGGKCPYQQKGTCFLFRTRRNAEGAHIIVVNHALLLSDLATKNRILPDYKLLVIDEAHNFEEEATDQLGIEVWKKDFDDALDKLSKKVGPERWSGFLFEMKNYFRGSTVPPNAQRGIERLAEGLHARVDESKIDLQSFFDILSTFVKQYHNGRQEYDWKLRLTTSVRAQPNWSQVEIAWESARSGLENVIEGLEGLYSAFEPYQDSKILDYEDLLMQLASTIASFTELCRSMTAIISNPPGRSICWITSNNRSGISLCAAPLQVSDALESSLFDEKDSVVLTSATLSTAGSFSFIKERLGFHPEAELVVNSPFDYENSALIYVATDVPEPGKPGHQKAVEHTLSSLFLATRGRGLVLFTSNSSLRESYFAIRGPLQREGVLVLGQGIDGSRKQLLASLKSSPNTVLLGTNSFWEGIDVVGDALSVLVIAKLPFSVPTDPVFAARSEEYDDPFKGYAVPQAVLRFKQGFGRLIRSKNDRGVVVILDRRIESKSYSTAFLSSLPQCTISRGLIADLPSLAVSWLRKGTEVDLPGEVG